MSTMSDHDKAELVRLAHQVAAGPTTMIERRHGRFDVLRQVNWVRVGVLAIVAALLALSVAVSILIDRQPSRVLIPIEVPTGVQVPTERTWSA
jgi:hypothetical protein